MSRAFIREEDTENFEPLPDRAVSRAPNDVTPEGLAQIESHIEAEQQALAVAQAAGERGNSIVEIPSMLQVILRK